MTDPAPPTNVVAARADRALALSWTAPGEISVSGYDVFLDGVLAASPTTTSVTVTGLTNGRSYVVTVRTHTTFLGATYTGTTASTPATGTPGDTLAPAAPAAVTAAPGDRQVALSWPASGEYDVARYELSRDGTVIATVTGTGYTDTGLVNGRTYAYSLVVIDTSGNRSTPTTTTAVPRDSVPAAAPASLGAAPGDRQVALSWPASGEYDVARYELSRDGTVIATVTGTGYTDTGLVNGTTYTYSLVVVDTSGNRSTPTTTSAVPRDSVPAAAPASLGAVPGDRQVVLSWPASGEYDVARYELSRDGTLIATVTGTGWTDTGLVNGTSYGYSLVVVDTSGNRSTPTTTSAVPRDSVPAAAPASLGAVPGDRQVVLSWPASGEYDVARYELSRNGTVIATVTGTGYTDTGLVNGTSYGWSLVVVDTSGNRSSATTTTAVPRDTDVPAAPTGLAATPGDGQVALSWATNAEADLRHYELSRDGVPIATVTGTGYTDTGLVNGSSYTYTLVAVDTSDNRSGASAPASATPVLATVPAEGAGESGGLAVSSTGRYVVVGTRARLEPSDTNSAYELYLFDRTAGTRTRIAPLGAAATGATDLTNTAAPAISDDGRYVVLATTAALLPTDTNRLADVYRRDLVAGTWALVSVPSGGAVSAGTAGTQLQTGASVYSTSPSVAVSADGNLVLFYSPRPDLVPGDTNGAVDVFAKNMTTGAVTRVSATASGANLPRTALGPALALTPDGRYALFPATSSNGPTVLYRKTLSGAGAGEAVVVSAVVVAGRRTEFAVHRDAGDVAISDDGQYVALVTSAKLGTPTPAANWTTGLAHRIDTTTGTSVAMGDGQTTSWEHQVELDPTGRYGFFSTTAAALPGDGNGHTDHYRRDLDGGPLVLVTADADGRATGGVTGSIAPAEYGRLFAVGADRVLITTSQALLATDANGRRDLYAKDLAGGNVSSVVG
ncbi:fibronectin type III domain-containing protein [Blastococcus sp. TF02-9]|uniref:fibronectin type III domain-containing protein n=1 Tax=Blastococcus sp. TF02-09 TaxID=2250576 RepID=UPI0011BEC718|nr:fibronectin type III domain-containing protein [Blastococcus sp. TF02-9]